MNGRKVSSLCVCMWIFFANFLLFIILNVTARWIIFAWTLLCIVLVSLCVIDLSITSLLHIFLCSIFLMLLTHTHKMHDHFGWMNWLLAENNKNSAFELLSVCVHSIEFFLSISLQCVWKKIAHMKLFFATELSRAIYAMHVNHNDDVDKNHSRIHSTSHENTRRALAPKTRHTQRTLLIIFVYQIFFIYFYNCTHFL